MDRLHDISGGTNPALFVIAIAEFLAIIGALMRQCATEPVISDD
jgi:hypothetical protein